MFVKHKRCVVFIYYFYDLLLALINDCYLFLSSKELTIFAYHTTMKNTPFDTVFYTKVIANRTWVLELKGLV